MITDVDVVRAWVRQAQADLAAAGTEAPTGSECHRRYWLQQACEKGIKALGLVLWTGHSDEEREMRRLFLHRHSPLLALAELPEPPELPELPRSVRRLKRQLLTEIRGRQDARLLEKVDATTPATDPSTVSYRYPFRDSSGRTVAPCDTATSEWDGYQGDEVGVRAAIERFLRDLDRRVQRERTPP